MDWQTLGDQLRCDACKHRKDLHMEDFDAGMTTVLLSITAMVSHVISIRW